MLAFERIKDYEQVMFCNEPESGLKAIIVIHDTTLGPALGGTRMQPYRTVDDALEDGLRLAKGMTYKCAAADVDFGGGKAILIGDPLTDKSPDLFRAFGQFVQSLHGRFYTGTDMGTNPEDFVHAHRETRYIVGLPETYGGHGDSSVSTAHGVIYGIKAVLNRLWNDEELSDKAFAVQGLGKVGLKVAKRLLEAGATVYATDMNGNAVKELAAYAETTRGHFSAYEGDAIYDARPADIFVPCAIGAILNDRTIERLRVKGVAGSANNQLAEDRHGKALAEAGILYAPDYIVNAGGLIQVADELYGPNKERVVQKTRRIYETLSDIFETADREGMTTVEAANVFCEKRLRAQSARSRFFLPEKPPKWRLR
jgi:phenylalanine dehydrogenase